MKIRNRNLLIIATLVWFVAGFNIERIGVMEYTKYVNKINIFHSIIVFMIFWFLIFSKLVKKHSIRIKKYGDIKQWFWNFFDLKSFLIMFFMMMLGIIIRNFNLAPKVFIAVFYTGLGSALILASVHFLINYFLFEKIKN